MHVVPTDGEADCAKGHKEPMHHILKAHYAGFLLYKYYNTNMLSHYYNTLATCVCIQFCPIPCLSSCICNSKNSSGLFRACFFNFISVLFLKSMCPIHGTHTLYDSIEEGETIGYYSGE